MTGAGLTSTLALGLLAVLRVRLAWGAAASAGAGFLAVVAVVAVLAVVALVALTFLTALTTLATLKACASGTTALVCATATGSVEGCTCGVADAFCGW